MPRQLPATSWSANSSALLSCATRLEARGVMRWTGQPVEDGQGGASGGSEPARPSAMAPRACVSGSVKLIIVNSDAEALAVPALGACRWSRPCLVAGAGGDRNGSAVGLGQAGAGVEPAQRCGRIPRGAAGYPLAGRRGRTYRAPQHWPKAHGGGLPGAVRPEEPEHLAVADLERDVSNATRSPKRLLRLWTDNAVAPWLAPDAALCMLCRLRARLRAASWSRAAVVAGASAAGMVLLRVFMVSPFFGYITDTGGRCRGGSGWRGAAGRGSPAA